ncbi:MAG TPA: ABC transporter substrate-binding protein [Dongiaceae bacterium]|nr:ABC transporter substrate-binding protein [Dongiaceae bacterium]
MRKLWIGIAVALGLVAGATVAAADTYISPPYFQKDEQDGKLPPVSERLPEHPAVAQPEKIGQYGGELHTLLASARDTRIISSYSYARLVAYDRTYKLVPDILESFEDKDDKVFTFHLRKGMKWSDGEPFTADDFRYWWEDVANNHDLSPSGPPKELVVNGKPPKVEFLDETTIRFTWDAPNADFLPALAGAAPLYIYRPAHYLKEFHQKYADPAKLAELVKKQGQPSWAALHNRMDNMGRNDNPALPTLDPWILRTKPPAQRFVFTRNPYYYRVDPQGRQLPYLDQVIVDTADSKLIPAKAGAGESDLQARYIRFDNYTFLKVGEKRGKYWVRLWDDGRGSNLVLFPNLNTNDEGWRNLMRDVRFRRALSLGIDRHEINQAIYFGLGNEGANTIMPASPLYKPEYRQAWAQFDPVLANRLLDQIGLLARDENGIRLMKDGRPLVVVVDSAGESTEESDVLELIKDTWHAIGIDLFMKPSQREVFRDRIFSGDSMMSVFFGIDNGFPSADMSPQEFTPTTQQQLMWPKWGQYIETGGQDGQAVDLPEAKQLQDLMEQWRRAPDTNTRTAIWSQILSIWADQVYTIGTVAGIPQPVVVSRQLENVPDHAMWAWEPGAQFGVFKPDTFWMDNPGPLSPVATNQ